MSEPNSKLFREDPAAYYTALGAEAEQERISKLLRSQVTRHHPVLEIHIDELEVLIKGELNGNS